LVTLFKSFIEKTCLAYLKTHEKLFKEWLYFSSLLSQELIDFPKIERYIDGLNQPSNNIELPLVQSELKSSSFESGFMRKKQEIVDKYKQTTNSNTNSLLITSMPSQYKTPSYQTFTSNLEEQPVFNSSSQFSESNLIRRDEIRTRLK
jgi:hypothetical protein